MSALSARACAPIATIRLFLATFMALNGSEARLAEPQHRYRPPLEVGEVDHAHHLSFKVLRPIRARMTAMIQKRMTMVGSAHPFFSKWWCSGAMRNTRLPVSL